PAPSQKRTDSSRRRTRREQSARPPRAFGAQDDRGADLQVCGRPPGRPRPLCGTFAETDLEVRRRRWTSAPQNPDRPVQHRTGAYAAAPTTTAKSRPPPSASAAEPPRPPEDRA